MEEVDGLRGSKVSQTDVNMEAGSVVKIDGSSGGQVSILYQQYLVQAPE